MTPTSLRHRCLVTVTVLSLAQLLSACAGQSTVPQTVYTPGLGEFMAQISSRHIKLWFAGDAQNWPLAHYELEEIQEGLDDLAKYHPTHDKVTGALPDLIAVYMKPALSDVEAALKAKDVNAFQAGYDKLTTGCNNCHKANGFSFNVITRPYANPFSNQAF